MKLPGEKVDSLEEKIAELEEKINNLYKKEYETISSGSCPSAGSSTSIAVDFTKYDKLILEIISSSNSTIEGTSYIMELDENGESVNRCINIINRSYNTSWIVIGHLYRNGNNLTLSMKEYINFTARNYVLKGILKN